MTEDERRGGRVEARPGLRVSVAPHFTCRPLGFRYIYIYNMYTMCGGEGGERDKLNMGEVGLNGFIFTSTLVWGEKNEFVTTILQIIFTPTFLAICIIYSSLTFKIHFKHLKCC